MIEFYKKRGETPLQALDRLRIEMPKLADETLSYAGRLDPMAEGILPMLVGKEENADRQKFLNKDKEYKAEFVLGGSTDTGDVLGMITKFENKKIEEKQIQKVFTELTDITTQTYPWYSSKTVEGKALFEYAREGNFDIERPTREIKIYSVKNIETKEVNATQLIEEIIEDVQSVKGDFRQEEIVNNWRTVILDPRLRRDDKPIVRGDNGMQLVTCTLKVSSGTYIRGLCEVLEEKLGVPMVLFKLVRRRVF